MSYTKDCPFCGSIAITDEISTCRWTKTGSRKVTKYITQCIIPSCVGHHGKAYTSEKKSIDIWNNRFGEPVTVQQEVECASVDELCEMITSALTKARTRGLV